MPKHTPSEKRKNIRRRHKKRISRINKIVQAGAEDEQLEKRLRKQMGG